MNLLEIVRGAYGLCQLVAPRLLAGRVLGTSLTPDSVDVIRVLGARHLVQGLITLNAKSERVRHLGGTVDALHALSMISVGIFSPAHRRSALGNAAVASTFAILEFCS